MWQLTPSRVAYAAACVWLAVFVVVNWETLWWPWASETSYFVALGPLALVWATISLSRIYAEQGPGWALYKAAFSATLLWFLCFSFASVANGWVTADSPILLKIGSIIAALGPPYGLWLARRLVTGRWL